MNQKNFNDFRYMEFIRKPQIGKVLPEIQCVALDYFDLIYMVQVKNFQECMTMDNNIPCEAYQGIGLFRYGNDEEKKQENDPFKLSQDLPFFAVLQVTYTPMHYRCGYGKDLSKELEDLQEVIRRAHADFLEKIAREDSSEFAVRTAVYYTVSTMDFCVVLKTNRLEFPLYLSNEIKRANTTGIGKEIETQEQYKKYTVYTMMGIYKDFRNLKGYTFMGEKTALVTRVHLKRSLHKEWENVIRDIIENEGDKSNHSITDTHSIPGRYDLTIRVNGKDDVLSVLPEIIRAIMESFTNQEGRISSHKRKKRGELWNSLDYIIDNEYAEYLNVRIFSDCRGSFGDLDGQKGMKENTKTEPIPEEQRQINLVEGLENKYKDLVTLIGDSDLNYYFRGYMPKLHQIIHICIALHCRYDTNISIITLSYYLIDFMSLLQMNIEFLNKGLVSLKDIGMNFVRGINYLQQFIKVVTSVNASSFEAPKYETEKDECCFVKLPIAYTQFLSGIFQKYYNDRNNHAYKDDSEVDFFPQYLPMVIPYMQNGNNKYMMTTLFAQSMSDQWDQIKKQWAEHIKNNKVPMFIICQDMDDYRNVSSVISSSLHEIGHYCNGMTRRQRNGDLVRIYSEEIAKVIVKKCMAVVGVNFQSASYALEFSRVLQEFEDSVYNGLVEWFLQVMEKEIVYPESVFRCVFREKFGELTNVYADCRNQNIAEEEFLISFLDEMRYTFNLNLPEKMHNKLEYSISSAIPIRCKKTLKSLKHKLGTYNRMLPFLNDIYQYIEMADTICEDMRRGDEKEVLDKIQDIKRLTENIDLKQHCQWNKQLEVSEDICTVRQIAFLLQEVQKCIEFLLRGIQKRHMLKREIAYEDKCRKLRQMIESKSELLRKICGRYQEKCQTSYPNIFQSRDGFAEVYQRMNLYPDSKIMEMEEMLNQALMGLVFPQENIINAGNCYRESIADIVMCVNLNLSVEEYFVKMNEVYHQYNDDRKSDTARLVIVMAYLLMGKETVKQYKVQHKRRKWLRTTWRGKFENLLESVQLPQSIRKMIGNYYMVIEDKLFDVTMSRVSEIADRIMLVENVDELNFVKEELSLVRSDHKKVKEHDESSELGRVQQKGIEFILKYYYQNRQDYAIKDDKEMDAEDCKGGDTYASE